MSDARVLRRLAAVSIAVALPLLVGACATAPSAGPETLLRDELFAPPSQPVVAADIFALSEPMKQYLRTEIATQVRMRGPQQGLFEAVYNRSQLKLDYDSTYTRNAAEAFDARAGNCLSLVIMTAAFAREMGLQVRFQSAYLEEAWTRNANFLMRAGHVNISLGNRLGDRANAMARELTIDFLPADQLRTLRVVEVSEHAIIGMYMNNRAVEALMRDQLDDAYAWARASLLHNPDFVGTMNTLGLIYARRDAAESAERVFTTALQRDPKNTRAMANLADLYARQGRTGEAAALRTTLAKLEPEPPFYFHNQGLVAMQRGQYAVARDFFKREIARGAVSSEVVFSLGMAYYRLGDSENASKYLNQALESSGRGERDGYSTKLGWLKSRSLQ